MVDGVIANLSIGQSSIDMLRSSTNQNAIIRSGRYHFIVFSVKSKELTRHIFLIYVTFELGADINIFAFLLGNIAGILQIV